MNSIKMNISVQLKNIAIVFSLSLVLSASLSAQGQDSVSVTTDRLELYKISNLWINSLNSAGLNISETLSYTEASGGYTYTKGNFRRQQEGSRNNGFLFNAEGATLLKGAYLWGKFSIETEKKRNSRFNASIIDPFRGMPYIIADNRSSDWRIQYYNLETRISTPQLFEKIYAGLGINYNVSTGAKQLDPRPKNRYYSLELTPSVVWPINNQHNIGGTFYFKNMHEISEIEFKNVYQDATFYYLEGLGAFTQTTGTGRNRDYRGNSFGGELEYSIQSEKIDFLLSGGYIYDYENVIDGTNMLINTSRAVRDNYSGNMAILFKGNKSRHKLFADASYQNINGIFYDKVKDPDDPTVGQIILNKKTRSKYRTSQFNLGYDYFRLNNTGYTLNTGANIRYTVQKDEYLLPQPDVASSTQDIHRYDFNIHGKYNINKNLPFNGNLLIGASATYSLAQDCELNYGGANEDHLVIRELLNQDFLFLSENYWKLSFEAQYSLPLKISNKVINAYGKAGGYIIPEVNQGKRANLTVSVGFIL